jgi:lincosamide nucleotidyltransferase A/C/D/E
MRYFRERIFRFYRKRLHFVYVRSATITPVSEADVLEVLGWVADLGVDAWLDGGWGVDALVGRQTRSHGDLDLVIEARHEHAFVERLREHGFAHVPMWYTTDAHTVWRDAGGRTVDLHLIVIDGNGDGGYGDEGCYPASGLAGTGAVGGTAVRCLSPEIQVEFHRGYEIRPQDRHDVGLLCEKFRIALPNEYQH